MRSSGAGYVVKAALLGALLVLPACSKTPEPVGKGEGFGKISGTVTYNGELVKYGYVLLYPMPKGGELVGKDPNMRFPPVASAPIKKDGTYEIPSAPAGMMKVCVATDPDVPLAELGAIGPKHGPPKDKGPKAGRDKGGPPDKGDSDKAEGPDKAGHPDKAGPDKGGRKKSKEPNPETLAMTVEEKRVLREIHKIYGDHRMSPLIIPIHPGEQTRDLELSLQKKQ